MTIQPGYNGLTTLTPGIPAEAYHDPRRFDCEMQQIWLQNWVYVGRSSEIPDPRSFLTFEFANQPLLLVRDDSGTVRGFYNTCRHRGAILCTEAKGRLRSGAIVCPYHSWAYSLDGTLTRTTSKLDQEGFATANFPLYSIHVREWRGFIFVSLAETPPDFASLWDVPLTHLDHWPLEELEVGHSTSRVINCNWKIFWENYNECLHCPSVHPGLSSLIPLYGRGLLEEKDDPQWQKHAADSDPKWKGGLRDGASTWSLNGHATGAGFAGLSEEERKTGYTYMTGLPSMVIAGHVDYVRTLRLLPLGPQQTQMRVDYLFPRETLADKSNDIRNAVDFTHTVLTQDADVCELTQRGLRAAAHRSGVIMPEEYLLKQFHEWVSRQLDRV
jgi:Rieske 2Fe-2S family protein